ncbi:PREDICTED: uncharacterized protein LOC109231557 [Nicotiana attenuata]|uniref:uncharacterized protein LOC109231557 n=1 Tax=Nicotiana attenuata TaxID=49451 RepID=UPI000905541E|nr:PREDICTED: uncharacterized protein LOC109231557 [Nicotiana attenuata]
MALYKALYGRSSFVSTIRHRSYDDKKIRDLAFTEDEKVLLRVSPMKGVMRFGKKEKLSPSYIGPFEVLDSMQLDDKLAYEEEPPAILDKQAQFSVNRSTKAAKDGDMPIEQSEEEVGSNGVHAKGRKRTMINIHSL